ncbi:MAG: hypothetical protein K6F86_08040 [Lachnospiraceae bacterium]|nr:hypothetical protein [Lachnospiraceae bacterium]
MKYSDEDALKEILKRSDAVVHRRNKNACAYLGGASAVMFAALVAVIMMLPGGGAAEFTEGSVYGAFLLSPQAGGYVLVAVLSFVIGVTVTLFIRKLRNGE